MNSRQSMIQAFESPPLRLGNWTHQGLPFYSKHVVDHITIGIAVPKSIPEGTLHSLCSLRVPSANSTAISLLISRAFTPPSSPVSFMSYLHWHRGD